MKVLTDQLFQGTEWHGYTSVNHLINAYAHDPVQIGQKLEQLTRVDLREDFVSMVMSHGVHRLDQDKSTYQWFLESDADENYPLLGAYTDAAMTSAIVAGSNYGAQQANMFLVYKDAPFKHTEHISGNKPDLYHLRVMDEPTPIGGDRWLYRVQLVNARIDSIPGDELLPEKTRWSSEGGSIADDRSDDGFGISFKTNGMLESRLGRFRMKHTLSSRTPNIKPLYFFVTDKSGKPVKLWISNVEYEFYRKARWTTAALIMWGKTTVAPDGSVNLMDRNGETITTGSGMKEQWDSSNLHLWSTRPNLDRLVEIAMSISVGRIPYGEREYVVRGGEWGLMALAEMVQTQLGGTYYQAAPYLQDTSGRAYKWNVNGDTNGIYAKLGQIMGVATINGIKFNFMIDPSKDMKTRNKVYHPLGGLASSYEYDIFLKDPKKNMQIMRRKGEEPMFFVENGPGGYFTKAGMNFKNPAAVSTAIEGSVIHYLEPGVGAIVRDPTKIVRYYPTQTQS